MTSKFLHLTPTETKSPAVAKDEPQNVYSPVSTHPKPVPGGWKSGLSLKDRISERQNDFTNKERRNAWDKENEAVKTYRDEMVKRWNDELDNLLVYAGLFSTIVTAFNVVSYSLLAPTEPDLVLAALTQISAQLASFSVHSPFVNSTQPSFQSSSVPSNSTSPQRWAVWLNTLWFSSLIFSLSAASVAIMVKEWLHEYNSRIYGTTLRTTRLRQHRYNGFETWKVAEIISILPILVQIASGLFLAGLLILLWNLHDTVAAVASTLVGALLAITLVTTILPTFTSNCAYLSPLSRLIFFLCRLLITPIRTTICQIAYSVWLWAGRPNSGLPARIVRISQWLVYSYQKSLALSVYAMELAHVTENPLKLDQDGFFAAYYMTGDLNHLEFTSTCFSDYPIDDLRDILGRIHDQNVEYGQSESLAHWTRSIPLDMASDMLLVSAWDERVHASAAWPGIAANYLSSCHAVRDQRRISCVLSNLTAVLYNEDKPHSDDFPMYQCVLALSKQLNVKETNSALTDVLRKRLIAAIHTVLHTRQFHSRTLELSECVQYLRILMFCCPPSTARSPPDMAEEDTRWGPLADAVALAEDLLVRKLESPEFTRKKGWAICFDVDRFFRDHEHFGLEHLAKRLSKKLIDSLTSVVKELPHGGKIMEKPGSTAGSSG